VTRRQTSVALPTVLICLALALSCAPSDENTPGAAVKTFYRHLNDGRNSEAMAMYNAEASRMFDDPSIAAVGVFDDWVATETKKRSIREVEIVDAAAQERSAEVKFRVEYDDGSSKDGEVSLTLEQGQWKLGLIR
jgi:hypothetical protein